MIVTSRQAGTAELSAFSFCVLDAISLLLSFVERGTDLMLIPRYSSKGGKGKGKKSSRISTARGVRV